MKNLFETARVEEVEQRLGRLQPDSQRQWGKMNPAQALAHCSAAFDLAMGKPPVSPRVFLGRLIGPLVKKSLLVKGEPMRRNATTEKSCFVTDERDFAVESQRLRESIDRFVAGGGLENLTGAEMRLRKLRDREQVGAAQQVVALLVAGVEGGHFHRYLEATRRQVLG